MSTHRDAAKAERLPGWLRKRVRAAGGRAAEVERVLRELNLGTVCTAAACPNRGECFCAGRATFMILGAACTRDCGFCAVRHASPACPDPDEPARVAKAAVALGLRHVVVTSVTRDDLADGGAAHFAATIQALRQAADFTVEVLVPDFGGDTVSLDLVLDAGPDVLNHNLETVRRLYPTVRPAADYERSLALLGRAGQRLCRGTTKSGFMLGLGETREEVLALLRDLRRVGCRMLTIGQYLRPSKANLPVERYVDPAEFEDLRRVAVQMGFRQAACGPFVRSSYCAEESLSAIQGAADARQG